jgi:hypothetical protein
MSDRLNLRIAGDDTERRRHASCPEADQAEKLSRSPPLQPPDESPPEYPLPRFRPGMTNLGGLLMAESRCCRALEPEPSGRDASLRSGAVHRLIAALGDDLHLGVGHVEDLALVVPGLVVVLVNGPAVVARVLERVRRLMSQ